MDIPLSVSYKFNLEFLGQKLNDLSSEMNHISYHDFLKSRDEVILRPAKKTPPKLSNQQKQKVFEMVFNEKNNQAIYEYEQKIHLQNVLKKYPQTLRGYSQYLTENKKNCPIF